MSTVRPRMVVCTVTEMATSAASRSAQAEARHERERGARRRREVAPQRGWLLIIIVVGIAVVWPVAQLQARAFADGGAASAGMPRIGDTIWTTLVLAIASSVLAVVLGALLAWCASLIPRSAGELVPLLPLIVPAVTEWIFPLSSKVGYLNMALRKLPFTSLSAVRIEQYGQHI